MEGGFGSVFGESEMKETLCRGFLVRMDRQQIKEKKVLLLSQTTNSIFVRRSNESLSKYILFNNLLSGKGKIFSKTFQ